MGRGFLVATVLAWCELRGVDFELGVEVDDQFSHEGGEATLPGFPLWHRRW